MTEESNSCKGLIERHDAESDFHDRKYGKGDGYPRHYAVQPTYPIYVRMLKAMGDLSGKRVLEYGCGEGWITRDLGKAGAIVTSFDISAEAVKRTQAVVESAGIADRCTIRQMGAEQLDFGDESFDIVMGFAILHHLDLRLAVPELCRVLRVGGVAYFAEPLGTNPLLNLYRRLTPQYRTADEVPLDLGAFVPMLSSFTEVRHNEYYILALASIALAYLPGGPRHFARINRALMELDDRLLRAFPRLGRIAWYTVLSMVK